MNVTGRAAKLLFVLAFVSAQAAVWAQPYGYSVNSRSNLGGEDANILWRLDLSSGMAERIGPTRFPDIEGLAFTPDGVLYGAPDQDKTLVTVNLNSGFSSAVGGLYFNMAVPLAPMDFGMTSTCDGELLVVSDIQESLFHASRETGRLERIGEVGSLGAPITDLASWGGKLYGIGQGLTGTSDEFVPDAPNLYRIDRDTATAEFIGSLGQAALPYANAGLAFDEAGNLWAITDRRANGVLDIKSEILKIDLETGVAQKTADADLVGFESLAIAPPGGCDLDGDPEPTVAVPADNTHALAILTLLMLMASWWTLHLRQR